MSKSFMQKVGKR